MGKNFTANFSQLSKSLGSALVASEGVRSMSKYIMNDKKGRRRRTEARQGSIRIIQKGLQKSKCSYFLCSFNLSYSDVIIYKLKYMD